eukprot:5552270-Amphidinium_carterae.1
MGKVSVHYIAKLSTRTTQLSLADFEDDWVRTIGLVSSVVWLQSNIAALHIGSRLELVGNSLILRCVRRLVQ